MLWQGKCFSIYDKYLSIPFSVSSKIFLRIFKINRRYLKTHDVVSTSIPRRTTLYDVLSTLKRRCCASTGYHLGMDLHSYAEVRENIIFFNCWCKHISEIFQKKENQILAILQVPCKMFTKMILCCSILACNQTLMTLFLAFFFLLHKF